MQVGDVIEVVFRNMLHKPVNLVLNGGLIPDTFAYFTSPVAPRQTVRISGATLPGKNTILKTFSKC